MAHTEEEHAKVVNPNLMARLPYPRMVYHADLSPKVVLNKAEHQIAAEQGWQDEPIAAPEPEVIEPVTLDSLNARLMNVEKMLGTILEQQERLENLLEAPKKRKGEQAA